MSAISATLRGRRAAERLMIDQCTVERVNGETEGAGGVLTPNKNQIYSGKCRIQVRTRERMGGSWLQIGEAFVILSRIEVELPMDAPEPLEGDIVTVTASVLDQQMVGKAFAVRDVMMKSFLTARRVTVIEVSS